MQSSITASNQVLIVGAGPSGLAAATFLTRLGVKVKIIDRNNSRSDKSKALGVQAGTLECLDYALGTKISQSMIDAGQRAGSAWIHIDNHKEIGVNLNSIPSRHNFILILAQSETERILEEYINSLNIKIERNTELIGIEQTDSRVTCSLRKQDGTEHISADFVIGCDGAHSTVRHLMGIPFEGATYQGDFILGDVTLEWPWEYGSVHTFVSKKGIIASFPMRGKQQYRLILIPKTNQLMDSQKIDFDEFRAITSDLSDNRIDVKTSTWLTRFRVHHRMVKNFQEKRVFLAGDAAHIHSPAGGQGMNTGIQDAFNLSYKLKSVLHGHHTEDLLRSYETQRRPVAKNVLRSTDFVFRIGLLPETPWTSWLRQILVPKMVSNRWLQKRVAVAISEVNVARQEIERAKKLTSNETQSASARPHFSP